MTTPRRLPLVPAYVTVNGEPHGSRSPVWAGLLWHKAQKGLWDFLTEGDQPLNVPFCHPDDAHDQFGFRVIRPRYDGWRFVRCRSGVWMLERAEPARSLADLREEMRAVARGEKGEGAE